MMGVVTWPQSVAAKYLSEPMKAPIPLKSELKLPRKNKPSIAIALTGAMVLLPLGVFLIIMYSGVLKR
jgi:hypothetical protein